MRRSAPGTSVLPNCSTIPKPHGPASRNSFPSEAPATTEVVRLLGDLAALAERDGAVRAFAQSYDQFVVAHRTKKALIRKLKAEGPVTATLSKLASD